MSEIDLLRALPKVKRNIQMRKDAKDPAVVAISNSCSAMQISLRQGKVKVRLRSPPSPVTPNHPAAVVVKRR
jgi:hypothetical protein